MFLNKISNSLTLNKKEGKANQPFLQPVFLKTFEIMSTPGKEEIYSDKLDEPLKGEEKSNFNQKVK